MRSRLPVGRRDVVFRLVAAERCLTLVAAGTIALVTARPPFAGELERIAAGLVAFQQQAAIARISRYAA